MTNRVDQEMVRELQRAYGAPSVRVWQSLPYVSVPMSLLMAHARKVPWINQTPPAPGTEALPMPWPRFVFEAPWSYAKQDARDGQIEQRVCVMASAAGLRDLIPNIPQEYETHSQAGRCAVVFYDHVKRGHLVAVHTNTDVVRNLRIWTPMKGETEKLANIIYNCLLSLIHLLTQSDYRLTEVRNTTPRVSRKTATLKPWLRDDLPRIVLLAPLGARQLHAQAEAEGNLPVTAKERHRPTPHWRRGHYRRLDEGRKTWVRAAWIGPTEWVTGGQIYRVLGEE